MSFLKSILNRYKVLSAEETNNKAKAMEATIELYMIAKDGKPTTWQELLNTEVGLDLAPAEREKAAHKAFKMYESLLDLPRGTTLTVPHFGKKKEIKLN